VKKLAAVLLLTSSLASADIPPDAQALFEQGIADMQANKLDVACKELAASLAKYADMGTKGALATCYTKAGKTASAWTLWKELADTEKDPAFKASAAQHASELGPKLPRYQIKLAGAAPAGLAVTINGVAVADPTLPTALPVDPGPLVVVATATDRGEWRATLTASEGKTTTIDIPELPAKGVESHRVDIDPPPPVEHKSSRKLYAGILGGVGLVGVAVGIVEGLSASSSFDDAKKLCGGDVGTCPNPMVGPAQKKVDDSRSAATLSTVAFGVGGAAVAAAVILYVTAPKESESRVAVRPVIAPSTAGVVLSGRW